MVTGCGRRRLVDRLRTVVDRHGDRLAVREPGGASTYDQLVALIASIRRTLAATDQPPGSPVGLFVERSTIAYASMWAAISLGRAYVPLSPSHPHARVHQIAEQAGIGDVVTVSGALDRIGSVGRRHIVADELAPPRPGDVDAIWESAPGGDVAYLLFTSGSTGRPKGVPISYENLAAFVAAMHATIPMHPGDVCSQLCELSFDFSVHEIFPTLLSGGTLCPARPIDLFDPAGYVAANDVTVWIAVPSLARVVLDGHRPPGDRLSNLRLSIFNGEALTGTMAGRWRDAAPGSEIWNTYGPTECTVAATAHRWSGPGGPEQAGIVTIGSALPGCRTAIDDGTTIVGTDDATEPIVGELLLSGPQRFGGYLDTALPSPLCVNGDTTWYRTGDRVGWDDGLLYHHGRLDQQVKVGGHRIELQEVEHRLRATLETDALAVIARPERHPSELVLFLVASPSIAITAESTGLPSYMLPRRVVTLPRLPVGAHGKIDRRELQRLAGREAEMSAAR